GPSRLVKYGERAARSVGLNASVIRAAFYASARSSATTATAIATDVSRFTPRAASTNTTTAPHSAGLVQPSTRRPSRTTTSGTATSARNTAGNAKSRP